MSLLMDVATNPNANDLKPGDKREEYFDAALGRYVSRVVPADDPRHPSEIPPPVNVRDLTKASPDDAVKWGLNPKEADGAKKIDVSLCPSPAIREIALAMMAGAKKPGRWYYNWRYNGLKTMRRTYLAGAMRHLQADNDGEDLDKEMTELLGRPVTHLGAAMACISIILDAKEHGVLVDDRPTSKDYPRDVSGIRPAPPASP